MKRWKEHEEETQKERKEMMGRQEQLKKWERRGVREKGIRIRESLRMEEEEEEKRDGETSIRDETEERSRRED